MDKYLKSLSEKVKEFNITLDDKQLGQFEQYYKILEEYNQKVNLVSSTLPADVFSKHFIDSLSLGLLSGSIDLNKPINLIDIGIGGGFPGIPLIIACPTWKLCALDSIGKKIKFLETLSEELGIKARVELINARAEDIAFKEDKREKFDLCAIRAVGKLAEISEYGLPFVKTGGYFVAYKAKDIHEEANQASKALEILGGKIENIISYKISNDEEIERNLVLIKKIKKTPGKYPRKAGIPKKSPLS